MKKIQFNIDRFKKKDKSKAKHKGADVVFTLLEKYDIDISDKWGKRLSGALLRKFKQGILEVKIGSMEESLTWIKENNDELYENIMKTNESRTKYLWNRLLK